MYMRPAAVPAQVDEMEMPAAVVKMVMGAGDDPTGDEDAAFYLFGPEEAMDFARTFSTLAQQAWEIATADQASRN
jgi:hypothetical protein